MSLRTKQTKSKENKRATATMPPAVDEDRSSTETPRADATGDSSSLQQRKSPSPAASSPTNETQTHAGSKANGSERPSESASGSRQPNKNVSLQSSLTTSSKPTRANTRASRHTYFLWKLLRIILLDLPLVLLFASFIAMVVLHYVHDTFLERQGHLMTWTNCADYGNNDDNDETSLGIQDSSRLGRRKQSDLTYYNRQCTASDISTTNPQDLILNNDTTALDCAHHMAKHGVSIYPNVLHSDTADQLRTYIVERNKVEEGFWVISGEHRYTFGIGVNQAPIVSKALHEIANNPLFRRGIEEVCGPNPAVIEFTAITSEYGAKDQFWHQDTLPLGSSFKHARTFVPSYSLFIPLQDTTADIGATQICPGSHVCGDHQDFCVENGFRVSSSPPNGSDSSDSDIDGVWPKAAGALVSQHLYHRGMAHTDPNGPDRVLFILTFSPRPRMNKGEVETRLISMGGSYSINWRQWGHTLDDFGSASTAMREPWKTMRSLGLYKPKTADWGWDWPAVTTMRIVNEDNGYRPDQLEDWLEEEGGLSFLPESLQGEYDEEEGWEGYIKQTIVNCEKALEKTYFLASGVYLVFFMALSLAQRLAAQNKSSAGGPSLFRRAVLRIVMTHALVFALACCAVYCIGNTQWARNIRNGKAFNIPIRDLSDDMPVGTLPFKMDVLVETKYNSEYLYGTNYIIEDAHPGNVGLKEIVQVLSNGYKDLSPTLKAQLTAKVVNWVGQDFGRFLTQNDEGNWYRMTIPAAQKVVHKEIIKSGNPIVASVLTELSYLMSETKFGVFRDMAIHRQHIPDMLNRLQDKILDPPSFQSSNKSSVTTLRVQGVNESSLRVPKSILSQTPTIRDGLLPETVSSNPDMPPEYNVEEPFPSAWTNEGDVVEARYKGVYNEWYKATVVGIDADSGTYHVEYDDGELDTGLCRLCIRPYKHLEVDETVALRDQEGSIWYEGRVINVYQDETFDIDTASNGLFERVPVSLTRRSEPEEEIVAGTRVEALYGGRGKEWFPAVVHTVWGDGTFELLYDDGDHERKVERRFIRPIP